MVQGQGTFACHQMGAYQTLRAHTLCTQLLVSFRVFLIFKKSRNHRNRSAKTRYVLFLEKKGPCQECTTQKSGVGMVTRIQISRYPDIQISGIRYEVSEKTNNSQNHDLVENKCLKSFVLLSVHRFEIILISDALTFQPASF